MGMHQKKRKVKKFAFQLIKIIERKLQRQKKKNEKTRAQIKANRWCNMINYFSLLMSVHQSNIKIGHRYIFPIVHLYLIRLISAVH